MICQTSLNFAALPCMLMMLSDFSPRYSYQKIEWRLNLDLTHVCNWLECHQLTLNINKSEFMLIDSIFANGKHLDEVQSFPYLGLVINKNKKLGLLRRIKTCLPLSTFIPPLFDMGRPGQHYSYGRATSSTQ